MGMEVAVSSSLSSTATASLPGYRYVYVPWHTRAKCTMEHELRGGTPPSVPIVLRTGKRLLTCRKLVTTASSRWCRLLLADAA
jgi:hypothetical protein